MAAEYTTENFEFDTPQDALDAFKRGEIDEETVRYQFDEVDGIDRSIAVARAKRINTKSREEVAETVTAGIDIDL